jgi:hypothetical protein
VYAGSAIRRLAYVASSLLPYSIVNVTEMPPGVGVRATGVTNALARTLLRGLMLLLCMPVVAAGDTGGGLIATSLTSSIRQTALNPGEYQLVLAPALSFLSAVNVEYPS